jgi:hypothetical protein
MKTRISRKIGGGLIALVISQVLLIGCATTSKTSTPQDQARAAKYERSISNADAHFGAE